MIRTAILPTEPFGALIFDCDGTLVDNLPAHYQAWSETLAGYGIRMTLERFHSITGMATCDIIAALSHEFGCRLDSAIVSEEKDRRYAQLIGRVTEVRQVADVARAYRGKVPLAVASGSGRSHVYAALKHVGLFEMFDAIVTSDDTPRNKPFPDILLIASERLRIPPTDCIVYEDSDSGVEAAKRAGMRFVDVRVLFLRDPIARYKWSKLDN